MTFSEEVDVCIVGGGVAGAILAFQLAHQGIDVLVLEAGPRHDPAKRYEYMRQSLYGIDPWASKNPGREEYPPEARRWTHVKAVGGSGLHWGANVDRLHESDFELRTRYGIGSDWPIRYRELEPYYTRAEKLIGVAGEDGYPWTPWRSERYPMPPFPFSYSDGILKPAFDRLGIPLHHSPVARNSVPYDGRSSCMSFAMCQTCPIFAKWTPDLTVAKAEKTGKVVVKSDTRVTRINCNKSGSAVESVTAASIVNGKPLYRNYHARLFILGAHVFESTRLLLLSTSASAPDGLGNQSGCVGKYFTPHLSVTVTAELKEKTYLERIGFATSQSHFFYESSRQEGGNAFVLYLRNNGIETPFDTVRQEIEEQIMWGDELKTRVQNRFGFRAGIQALIEQLPYKENQISLDKGVADSLGLPVPKTAYSFNQKRESQTINKTTATMRKLFETLGAKHIRSKVGVVVSHHMGACRMGEDPKVSVVDRDLKVHGLHNLYVAGSSVFPNFGAIGPTLTIAALAVRLADHVSGALGHTTRTH
jgi:glucose dehydrogenase